MATTKTRKPQPEITGAAIFRCIDKASGKVLGYGVPSDSEPNTTYYVQWDASKHCYTCTCKGGQCANCKHRRAVVSVLTAKKEIAKEIARANNLCNFFAALATYEQEEIAKQAVAEAEHVVQPPQRYCDMCSCAGALEMVDGLMLCETCAEATRPAPIEPPTTVAAPTIAKRENAPLGNNRTFSLSR